MKKTGNVIARLTAAVIAVLLAAAGAIPALADDAVDPNSPPTAEGCTSVYLYNFENDRVLYERDTEVAVYPASTVKLMTGILAAETLGGDLDQKITVTDEMLALRAGNNIGLVAGEIVTARDMMYACLEGGANDAALVLACAVAGSVSEFVSMMNTKAALLGAFDTHYTNPTGLHDDAMVTTCKDTAIIAKYAASIPLIAEVTSSPKYVMEATNVKDFRNIYNRNCLISKFYDTYEKAYRYEYATGMNAGGTTRAGACVVATAKNSDGDLTYLCVLMGCTSDERANAGYAGAIALFDWAFAAWKYADVLSTEDIICEIPVTLSSAIDFVTLAPANDVRVYLPCTVKKGENLEYSYTTLYESLAAPVVKGSVAGAVTVIYDGEVIGSSDLVATVDIDRSELLYTLSQIEKFTKSRFFIATIVSAVILTVIYVLVKARVTAKTKRY